MKKKEYDQKLKEYLQAKDKRSKTYHIHPEVDNLIRKIQFHAQCNNKADGVTIAVMEYCRTNGISID